jgi:tetratricopeptide (TPR) repeat protein
MLFPQINLINIDKKTFRNSIVLFIILSFLIFGKSIKNDYAMDDEYVVLDNKQVQKGISAIPEILTTTYVMDEKQSYEYRPLVKVFYAIEYEFFGANPHVSHFINILLYVFSISLLFFVLLKLFDTTHYVFSLMVALFFLVHPLHSEVVMSLKNRDVILSFIGSISALYFALRYVEKNKIMSIVWCVFFMLFALLAKKDSMTFFVIIPFTLWYFKGTPFKKIAVVFSFSLIAAIIFKLASSSVVNEVNRKVLGWENPLYLGTKFWERIPQGFHSIYFYVKMYVFPHPLISYYGYNQVPMVGWGSIIVWVAISAVAVSLYYIYKNLRTKNAGIYGLIFYFISISMFTNIIVPVVGIVGERFAFIPSLGLTISFVWLLFKLFKISMENNSLKISAINTNLFIVAGVVLFLFGLKTYSRNAAWKDGYTLYETDVKTATESAHTHSLFAAGCIKKIKETPKMPFAEKQKNVNLAIKHYKESIRILPNYITSLNNIGMTYYSFMNNPTEAMPYLEKAIVLDTAYTEAYFNLATCYAALSNFDKAEKYYLKTISLNNQFVPAYQSLSNLYGSQKEYQKILKLNEQAIEEKINSDFPYINIANVYIVNSDTVTAVSYLEKAIAIVPRNDGVNSFLANYYKKRGDFNKAEYYMKMVGMR